jgi:hypothetical protein
LYSVSYTFTNPSFFIDYIAKVFAAGHSFKYFISYFPVRAGITESRKTQRMIDLLCALLKVISCSL